MAGTSPAMTDGGWNVCAKQRFIASPGHDVRMLATLRRRSGNSVIDLLTSPLVMPGLVPGIHVLGPATKDVDGRDKPDHDGRRPGRREISNSPIQAHTSPFSRRDASEFSSTALIERAQGMPGARCTRSLACKNVKSTRGSHHRFTGTIRHSPRSGLTAYFVISPAIGLCCHRHLRG